MSADLDAELKALGPMKASNVRTEWRRVIGDAPPAGFNSDLLARGIAHKLQEKAYGRLSPHHAREFAALVRAHASGKPVVPVSVLKPGTRLSRAWHGEGHHVIVLDSGYEYRGRHHASLTAIAKLITGAAWSGPRFFGLKPRKAAVSAHA